MLTRARPPVDATAAPGEWGRGRLVAALMLLLLIALSLAAGVVLWVWLRFHPAATDAAARPAQGSLSAANGAAGGTVVVSGGSIEQVQARRDALAAARRIGFPVVVRPSNVLGGRAMEIVRDAEQLDGLIESAIQVSGAAPVLLDVDDAVAERWLADAAARRHPRALFNLGAFAVGAGRYAEAVEHYERAAAAGVPVERIVTTWPVDDLLAWSRRRR